MGLIFQLWAELFKTVKLRKFRDGVYVQVEAMRAQTLLVAMTQSTMHSGLGQCLHLLHMHACIS